ncbi:helix-turn-helix transcriptional regulator [Pseudoalteromonas mariniglutinosa]|uniref:helix-turn-helix transcriptional regulator n=1 Tax=Pseudoalteromonas mariniglutinosa TaxID=206042 RepID=UPI00384DEB95
MSEYAITNSIRTLRFLCNEMTQKQLADAIGVTRQTVMAIEANKYSPSLEVAFKISAVFNLPLEEVFQYKAIDV